MSAFAGIVAFNAAAPNKQTEDLVCRAITALRPGKTAARRLDGALFAQKISTGSISLQPSTGRSDRILFAALARLDNREELGAALGLAPTDVAHLTDADLLLRTIEHHGDAGLARCLGAFAFALWDADSRRLTLGRDCLGNKPLFYHRGRGFVAFATTLGALLALPGVPREIDEIALAHFMALDLNEGARTLYRGIERVPSRTLVTIDGAGVRRRHYWAPNLDAAPPYRRDQDFIERAREPLRSSSHGRNTGHAARRHRDQRRPRFERDRRDRRAARHGAEHQLLHHGAATRHADRRRTVSISRRTRQGDGTGAHTSAARTFGGSHLPRLHPFEEDYARFFARANAPVLAPLVHAWYAHLTDAVAAAGHRVLLIGNYGNFGLTWRGNFALLALLRNGAYGEFARELRAGARHSGRSVARTFVGEVLVPGAPAPLRRFLHRLRGRDPDSVARYSALNPDFIAEHRLDRQWQSQGFDPWFGGNGWNPKRHRAARMFDQNQVVRDLAGMAEEINGFEIPRSAS